MIIEKKKCKLREVRNGLGVYLHVSHLTIASEEENFAHVLEDGLPRAWQVSQQNESSSRHFGYIGAIRFPDRVVNELSNLRR